VSPRSCSELRQAQLAVLVCQLWMKAPSFAPTGRDEPLEICSGWDRTLLARLAMGDFNVG
jgi:hypothetical protein